MPLASGKSAAPLVCSIAALLALVTAPSASRAANSTWSDGGITTNWSEAQNWTGSILPQNGDSLTFDTHPGFGAGTETIIHDLSTLTTVNSITFGTQSFTLNASGSNALILTNGITNTGSVSQTINIPLTLGASQTWDAGGTLGQSLTIGGNVGLGANQLTIQGASALVIGPSSTFSGTGAIVKNGAGQLTVNGTINTTGGLTISAGTLGGTGNIATNLAYDSTSSSSFAGSITGANTGITVDMLTTSQNNILTLTGNNTYGGATHIITGFLGIDSANALSGSGVVVESGASLAVGGGLNITRGVPITISGDGVEDGTAVSLGALIGGAFQQGDSSYAGRVTLGGNARIGSFDISTFTLSGGIDTAGHTLTLGSEAGAGNFLAVTGAIIGSGNVVIDTESTHFGAANTYTGSTSIINGATLYADVAGALPTTRTVLSMDSTGTGSSTLQLGADQAIASLDGSTTSTVQLGSHTLTIGQTISAGSTFAGSIIDSGAGGSLVKDGINTEHLTGTNSYTGATIVSGGVLSIDSANALSGGSVTVQSGGTLNINGGVNVSIAVPVTISGPGEAPGGTPAGALVGSGFTSGASSLNAPITLGADATFAVYSSASVFTLSGTIDTAGHTLTLGLASASGSFAIDSVISGAGGITVARNTTLGATNTYTGMTAIINGANLTASAAGALPGSSAVVMDQTGSGSSILTLGANQSIASLAGATTSLVNLGANSLTIGSSNAATSTLFAGIISGTGGELIKNNASTLILSGANSYSGGTQITSGRLITQNAGALGSGQVSLSGGILQVQGTLSLSNNLVWQGGKIGLALASGDVINVAGSFANAGGGTFALDLTGAQKNTVYTLVNFGATTFTDATQFSVASVTPNVTVQGSFLLSGTNVQFTISGATATGSILENAAPVNTPIFADFIVQGQTTTGGPKDNNQVQTLSFLPGSSLLIHNTLFVTQGPVTLPGGATITLDGSLSASELRMLFGSLLNGNGNIIGNLINGGLVSPGHSPGQIHVTGNYTQSQSGMLLIQIAGRDLKQHDLLSVGGTATLGGALEIVPLDGFKLKRNEPVTFLTANGGVNGKFATVEGGFTSDTILEPTIIYRSNSVELEAVQGSFEKFADHAGLTPNQKSVAQALDSLPTNNRRTNSLLDYLDYRKLNELPRDFDKIAPEELTSVFTIGVSLATVQSQNIQRRNDDIRSGSGGFNAAGLALNSDGPSYSGSFFNQGVAGPNGDDGKEIKQTQPITPEEARWGAFLSGTGEWVNVGNTDNARGYNLESGGFTLGLDYKVTPNLAIGVAGGYTGTTADLADGGRVYVNGGKIGLYATFFDYKQEKAAPTMSKDNKEALTPTYAVAQGLYADVAVFGGYNSYDTHRSALQGETRGDTDGGELNVLFGTGYDFKKGNLTFGPTASFNYTYLGTNAFTEHGSLAPLDIHGGKGESLRSAFGVKASYDWKVGGILIKPELRAAWQHEYGDSAYSLDSSFANGMGDTFRVNGPQLGRDSVLLGAGFAIQLSERCSTYFYYDGELGRTNYQSTSVTGGLRLTF